MLVTTVIWSVVLAVSFEFARVTKSYDYPSFFRKLLRRGWFVFEIAYLAAAVLVLSVIGSATGELDGDSFGIPKRDRMVREVQEAMKNDVRVSKTGKNTEGQ